MSGEEEVHTVYRVNWKEGGGSGESVGGSGKNGKGSEKNCRGSGKKSRGNTGREGQGRKSWA